MSLKSDRLHAERFQVPTTFLKERCGLARFDGGDRLNGYRGKPSIEMKRDHVIAIGRDIFGERKADLGRGWRGDGMHANHPDRGFHLGMLPVHRITAGQDKAG